MSKNVKNDFEQFENYFTETEEGEYITKKIYGKDVKKIYIYSTVADVTISSSATSYIEATLQGELYGEQFYFSAFRLDGEKIYIYATCNVERKTKINLNIILPKTEEYKVNVVTNKASVTAKNGLLVKKLKVKIGKGLQK